MLGPAGSGVAALGQGLALADAVFCSRDVRRKQ